MRPEVVVPRRSDQRTVDTIRHRLYLVPGLFGFARLATHEYFAHLERGLASRFEAAGVPLAVELVPAPPTASIVERTRMLARQMSASAGSSGGSIEHLHILGHSTGGLDGRLLLAPEGRVLLDPRELAMRERVRSLVTLNTPHYGTPLAGYFTTAAGTRLLYLLSLLSTTTLSVGRLPLEVLASGIGGVGALDKLIGHDLRILRRVVDPLLRIVGGRDEIHAYLDQVVDDRAGIVQLMPEVMELFNASVSDHPAVRYGCVASAAPPPGPRHLGRAVFSPFGGAKLALYSVAYGFARSGSARFGYAQPDESQADVLARGVGSVVDTQTTDGIVPTLSMLWRELIFACRADHLDVVGHFADSVRPAEHVDWVTSGSHFTRADFGRMLDAITAFMLRDG